MVYYDYTYIPGTFQKLNFLFSVYHEFFRDTLFSFSLCTEKLPALPGVYDFLIS